MDEIRSKIFVLIGPSGVGKSTLITKLKQWDFPFSELVSYTTRPRRVGEEEGRDYYFVSQAEYAQMEESEEFILSTQVHGNWYGISKKWLKEELQSGHNVLCSLNTEAARNLKKLFGKKVVTIFVAPPSFDVLVVAPSSHLEAIRVMSYNIRMAPCAEDEATENAWSYRLPKINMIIERYEPDIIGLQEVSLFQMSSVQNSSFDLPYKTLGKYPSREPIESGLGIVYNSQKILLISDLETIWLNEARNHSKGPAWDGSACERYVIYAKFRNLLDGNEFWFMTTHFDHLGQKARQESGKIVMDLAERLDAPAIVTGDFNCFPQQGGPELYQLLSTYSPRIKDSKTIAHKIFGIPGSWIGWDYDAYKQRTGYAKYDFIFTHDSIEVQQHGIIDDCVWDDYLQKELYPSDHRPVLSDLKLETNPSP